MSQRGRTGHRTKDRRTIETGPRESPPGRFRIAAGLVAFALIFTTLQLARSTQQSATWDEPMHLTAGYLALTAGDFRVDPSHPPLARAWAAVPLALTGRAVDTSEIDRTAPSDWLTRGYAFARTFVSGPDIDRTLLGARLMVIAWGVALGCLIFAWALELMGLRAAIVAVLLYTLEPNLAAHSALVTTDAGVTVFVFASVYFLWRYTRHATRRNLAACAGCVALAAVTKFSAAILAPIVVVLLAFAMARRELRPRQALLALAAMAAATVLVIWAAYGFRYAPSSNPQWLLTGDDFQGTVGMPWVAAVIGWLDAAHLLPNAFAQGFIFSLSSARQLPAFLAGEVRPGGWWYYFPVAIALKTPIALLGLATAGVVILFLRRSRDGAAAFAFVLVPIAAWLIVSAGSGVNLGVRHVLPIYPFLVVAAAAAGADLLARRRAARAIAVAALLTIVVEVGRSEPYPLSFFNTVAGGPTNGFRYLADSNLGWGGNLKALKRWMDARAVPSVSLAYFGSVDPAVYGIRATYLPSSATFLVDRIGRPQLPGYVAISGTALDGVYLPAWWRHFYAGLHRRTPVAVVGNTMRIYWLDQWPDEPAHALDRESLHTLAEGLLFGMRWPEHAIGHYREYLDRHPTDAAAWNGMSLALAQTGRPADALQGFRRVLALAPDDPDVRRNIAILEREVGQRRLVHRE